MNENELISRLDRIEEQLTSLNRDVVAAIASGKSAHHRIDDLKKRHLLDPRDQRDRVSF